MKLKKTLFYGISILAILGIYRLGENSVKPQTASVPVAHEKFAEKAKPATKPVKVIKKAPKKNNMQEKKQIHTSSPAKQNNISKQNMHKSANTNTLPSKQNKQTKTPPKENNQSTNSNQPKYWKTGLVGSTQAERYVSSILLANGYYKFNQNDLQEIINNAQNQDITLSQATKQFIEKVC